MQARSPRDTADIAPRPFDPRALFAGAGIMLALLAVGALGIVISGNVPSATDTGGGLDGSTTTNAAADDEQPETDAAAISDETNDENEPPEPAGPESQPEQLTVSLADPLGLTQATAETQLDLDPASGEICYTFAIDGMDSPYGGHIHIGPAGVMGGIVFDLGTLNDTNPTGCLPNTSADTKAILRDLGGHYVELHSADGTSTIRGQMGDVVAPPTDNEVGEGGAVVVVDDDRIRLVGEVPDQETIDQLAESFADIDLGAIPVDASELVVRGGAPRPSGRILVDAAVLFDIDSAELPVTELPELDTLAIIFQARPAWQMTVVGHTDNTGTDNLALSLQRAVAVRDAMESRQVSADSLQVEGAGATRPIASNSTEEGRARNRRIEFVIQAG